MNKIYVNKHNIEWIGYDIFKRILELEFNNGIHNQYLNVPLGAYIEFLNPSSRVCLDLDYFEKGNYQLITQHKMQKN